MTSTELAEFLRNLPTGALCIEEDGHLIALPTQVLSASDGIWDVSLSGRGDVALGNNSQACLVADGFTTYSAIRGFIVQGSVTRTSGVGAEDKTIVAVRSSRVRTFSFAAVSD
jgi:hypothetical protein